MSSDQNRGKEVINLIDLTKPLGARRIDHNWFLYATVQEIMEKLRGYIDQKAHGSDGDKHDDVVEHFITNVFIQGNRGTGKSSILLTVKYELEKKYDDLVDILYVADVSVFYESVLLYIVKHIEDNLYRKRFGKSITGAVSLVADLEDLLYKVKVYMPEFILKFCTDKLCSPEQSAEAVIEKLSSEFMRDFRDLINKYLKYMGKEKLVVIIDDIDLIPYNKVLYKLFLELGVFCNLKEIILIGAGNVEVIFERLEGAVRELMASKEGGQTVDDKNIDYIVRSLFGKVFPTNSTVILRQLQADVLKRIQIKWGDNQEKIGGLKEFLEQHPSFAYIVEYRENVIYEIFSGFPIRDFVALMQKIKESIEVVEKSIHKEDYYVHVSQLLISRVLITLTKPRPELMGLKIYFPNVRVKLKKVNANYKIEHENIKVAKEQAWSAFVSYLNFLYEYINKHRKDERLKKILNVTNRSQLENLRIGFWEVLGTIDREVFKILYLWLSEVYIYFHYHRYLLPLDLTMRCILMNLPAFIEYFYRETNIYEDKKKQSEQEDKKKRRKQEEDKQSKQEFDLYNNAYSFFIELFVIPLDIVEFDRHLNRVYSDISRGITRRLMGKKNTIWEIFVKKIPLTKRDTFLQYWYVFYIYTYVYCIVHIKEEDSELESLLMFFYLNELMEDIVAGQEENEESLDDQNDKHSDNEHNERAFEFFFKNLDYILEGSDDNIRSVDPVQIDMMLTAFLYRTLYSGILRSGKIGDDSAKRFIYNQLNTTLHLILYTSTLLYVVTGSLRNSTKLNTVFKHSINAALKKEPDVTQLTKTFLDTMVEEVRKAFDVKGECKEDKNVNENVNKEDIGQDKQEDRNIVQDIGKFLCKMLTRMRDDFNKGSDQSNKDSKQQV